MRNFEYSKPSRNIARFANTIVNIIAFIILLSSIYVFWYLNFHTSTHMIIVVSATITTVMASFLIYNLTSKINNMAENRDLRKATMRYYYEFTDRYNVRPLSQEIIVNKIDDFDIGQGVVIRAIPTVEEDGTTPLLIKIDTIEEAYKEKEYDPNEEIYKYY